MMKLLLFFSLLTQASPPDLKVVALSPALAEVVYALKKESHLVGVSDYTDFPESAQKLPSVGPYNKPLLEKIVHLKPDVVLVPKEGPEDVRFQLERAKLKYEVFAIGKLSDVGEAAERIAALLGEPKVGQSFKDSWDKDLQAVLASVKPQRTRTLIEIQKDPLIVAGGKTFLNEMISSCGGENIFHDLKGYPRMSLEMVLMKRPELILVATKSSQEAKTSVARWEESLKAQAPKVVVVDPDLYTRPGPRLLEGLKSICKILADRK